MASRKQAANVHQAIDKRIKCSENMVEVVTGELFDFLIGGGEFDPEQLGAVLQGEINDRLVNVLKTTRLVFQRFDVILDDAVAYPSTVCDAAAAANRKVHVDKLRHAAKTFEDELKDQFCKVDKAHSDWQYNYFVNEEMKPGQEIVYNLFGSVAERSENKQLMDSVVAIVGHEKETL